MMTDETDNSGARKYAKNTRGRPFEKGNPGRPAGSRNQTTIAIESLMGRYGEQVAARVIRKACDGDMVAARLVLDRIAPPRRGRPVRLKIGDIANAASVMSAQASLVSAVAAGQLTAEEAEPVSAMLAAYLKTVETVDLDRRVSELEGKIDGKSTMVGRK
jgi:hypothetical protein